MLFFIATVYFLYNSRVIIFQMKKKRKNKSTMLPAVTLPLDKTLFFTLLLLRFLSIKGMRPSLCQQQSSMKACLVILGFLFSWSAICLAQRSYRLGSMDIPSWIRVLRTVPILLICKEMGSKLNSVFLQPPFVLTKFTEHELVACSTTCHHFSQ